MLGNWSFGNYFKKEAIEWAWELLTKVYGLQPDRLYATYFQGDPSQNLPADLEARDLWQQVLPADHVLPGNAKDNFWEMGDVGPCGPCSELHYDRIGGRNAASLVNHDDPDVLEIWNLVFMQYQRREDRSLLPLPACHVDTGMGFERLVSVLHDVRSNYDTPVFSPIFEEISRVSGARPYAGKFGAEDPDKIDMAYRVVADHIRTLSVAIADGSGPGPVGREYVLRRILRRALRYWNEVLGSGKGTFTQLVPVVAKSLAFFPEVSAKQDYVVQVIREEETRFERTLHRGTVQFNKLAEKAKKSKTISGADIWDLWSTFGFPVDLTALMAEEKGLTLDMEGLEKIRNAPPSDVKKKDSNQLALDVQATALLQKENVVSTDDLAKFEAHKPCKGKVVAIFTGKEFAKEVKGGAKGTPVGIILDKTNFYAEAGGQVADIGELVLGGDSENPIPVSDTQRYANYVVHSAVLAKDVALSVGTEVECFVDLTAREPAMANHTGTHILNHALERVLGNTVDQKGSLVDAERLRFDFSHKSPVSDEELLRVEDLARKQISDALPVYAAVLPLEQAMSINSLRAVFGEKYPDPVRVISVGRPIDELVKNPKDESNWQFSVELCGGTHLSNAGEAKLFCITSETGVSQGVRRIIAVTGAGAERVLDNARVVRQKIAALQKQDDSTAAFETAVGALQQFVNQTALPVRDMGFFRDQLKLLVDKMLAVRNKRVEVAMARAKELVAECSGEGAPAFMVAKIDCGSDKNALSKAVVALREGCPAVPFMVASHDAENVVIMTASPKGHAIKAGDWAKHAIAACGGKGGGSPESGQGTSSSPAKLDEALDAARAWAAEKK